MNTWAAQTMHAMPITGIGPTSALASIYSSALAASAVLLALVMMTSPGRPSLRRRPNLGWRATDLWQRVARLARERRRRLDLLLVQMLADDVDQPEPRKPVAAPRHAAPPSSS